MTSVCIAITSLQFKQNLIAERSNNQINLEKLSLKTTSTWKDLGSYLEPINQQEEKRAMIVQITFRSKKALKLKEVTLKWTGDQLRDDLSASLYKKREFSPLRPIQKNLVSDGEWNPTDQQLTFDIDEKLVAINKYYLILNFSPEIEKKLKSGKFILSPKKPLRVYSFR